MAVCVLVHRGTWELKFYLPSDDNSTDILTLICPGDAPMKVPCLKVCSQVSINYVLTLLPCGASSSEVSVLKYFTKCVLCYIVMNIFEIFMGLSSIWTSNHSEYVGASHSFTRVALSKCLMQSSQLVDGSKASGIIITGYTFCFPPCMVNKTAAIYFLS